MFTTSSFAQSGGQKTSGYWKGAPGITVKVSDIMAQERPRRPEDLIGYEQISPDIWGREEGEYPDRSKLRQNPRSPQVAQWPVPSKGRLLAYRPTPLLELLSPSYSPQPTGVSFNAINVSASGAIPPDTQGCVGPTQIVVCANGRIRVFDKNGVMGGLNVTTNTFFNSVRNGSGTSDPRVRFDPLTQRWFILIINVSSPNRILIAVSSGPTITDSSSFTFYQFQQDLVAPAGNTGQLCDYPTLGIDNQALYIGGNMFGASFQGTSAWVVKKSSVLSGGPIEAVAFRGLAPAGGAGPYTPQGVDNYDPTATEGYFIGVDNVSFGVLVLRRVTNLSTTPTISGNINLTVPSTTSPSARTVLGSTRPLDAIDDRLYCAQIFKDTVNGLTTLWTAHHFRVTSAGVASSTGTRLGTRWYEIQNFTGTPSLRQSGTVFDPAASNASSYWFGAAAMSGQGHMAISFSNAGPAQRAEIAAAGRFASDPLGTTQSPTVIQTSSSDYNIQTTGTQRWGDYSYVAVDPTDRMTMWSFQEYCDANNSWGVRVVELLAPPPAQSPTCAPTGVAGGTTTNVVVTGSTAGGAGFYDPPQTWSTNRLAASITGSGVTINSVTFNSPSQMTMNVTVTPGAALGARTVTITNPDGQTVTTSLTINPGTYNLNPLTFSHTGGLFVFGNAASLAASDNSYVEYNKGVSLLMDLESTSPIANAQSITFRAETNMQTPEGSLRVSLFDFVANAWEQVDAFATQTNDNIVVTVAPASVNRFIQTGTRKIRARLGFKGDQDPNASYSQHIDWVQWTIVG
ncbi:MAG: hypothetical protein KF784_06045 [Fimbriimonadaceae bacterium]|nr:hypothetical protein [Fimbriimonadaceae bacterium]